MASFQPRVIEGAYVSLDQLLALRFRPAAGRRRPTSTFTGAQTGLRLGRKAEQRAEGTGGGRAPKTGQCSDTGHRERVQHDSLVVTVL